MKTIEKYWKIFLIIVLICSNVVTYLWDKKNIANNTGALESTATAVELLTIEVIQSRQWQIDHDTRHEDHNQLHEAERQ